mmetsp:Transcript_40523/g.127653  ORF Transcript_40523/g.127653 Transcript_40523/m.127653 type:complete len:230 (+) Transcript_40523:1767-2456(+)
MTREERPSMKNSSTSTRLSKGSTSSMTSKMLRCPSPLLLFPLLPSSSSSSSLLLPSPSSSFLLLPPLPSFLTAVQVEMQSLRLLTIAQRLKFIPQSLIAPSPRVDKSSQKLRGAWKAGVKAMLRSPHHPTGRRGSQEINVEGLRRSPRRSIGRVESKMDKEINFITGPKFDVQSKRNKIQIPTYPTLKDIDTPRDSTFAMTSEEVKRYVMVRLSCALLPADRHAGGWLL